MNPSQLLKAKIFQALKVGALKVGVLDAALVVVTLSVSGCGSTVVVGTESYPIARRQLPPAPVYSRMGLQYHPHPAPLPAESTTPLYSPTYSLQMTETNLGEALRALGQALGYTPQTLSTELAARPVNVRLVGTAEEVTARLAESSQVDLVLDHSARIISVTDLVPRVTAEPVEISQEERRVIESPIEELPGDASAVVNTTSDFSDGSENAPLPAARFSEIGAGVDVTDPRFRSDALGVRR